MLNTKFRGNRPAGSTEEDFRRISTIYGRVGHRPALCYQICISLYPKAFIQNLVQIGTVVSEKIQFEFLYVHDLGPRSRNDLDLQYSHIFIYSTKLQITGCNGF